LQVGLLLLLHILVAASLPGQVKRKQPCIVCVPAWLQSCTRI
jgi:hypothetical protein